MDYIENVLLATGGYAAPVENLSDEEIPDGYHRMPDGTIMKDSEHDNEAALEKNSDDPCWSGYVQVGMKDKNGKRVPNCVPSASTLDYIVASANAEVGPSRHLSSDIVYEIARRACTSYESISDDELYSAVLWDVLSFVEYATQGHSPDTEEMSAYSEFLPEGHPETESSLVASLAWVAGAPELDNSGRQAIIRAFSDESDYVESLHASTRLKVLVSSGKLSEATTTQLKTVAERYRKVD